MATSRDSVNEVLDATHGQPVEVQAAAVQAALQPAQTSVNWLWKALVIGLVAILIISLGGVIWSVTDGNDKTSPDVIVTLFTAVLTGLIGLFVKSPVRD